MAFNNCISNLYLNSDINILINFLSTITISIIYISLIMFITIIFSILINFNFKNWKYYNTLFNINKYLHKILLLSFLVLIIFKILLYIYIQNMDDSAFCRIEEISLKLSIFKNYYSLITINFLLGDIIVILAYTSGLVCTFLLGERNIIKNISNLNLFSLFIIFTTIMVYTTNVLVMFIAFECIFVPTIYYAFTLGYTKKIDKAIKFLFYWTLFGAFLVLVTLSYVYYNYKTLNYLDLINISFSKNELLYISLSILIGFGVKVPVFPFHFWLTKIHVEAPAGFSIFLSGFLVKAAIYCLYIFNNIFFTNLMSKVVIFISLIGMLESSCKLWTQTDFKKTIAFATIQEMNMILLLLISFSNTLNYSIIIFILMHGWLSTMMFFMVDVIQKKAGSRNIVEISGLNYLIPKLRLYIWIMLIFITGFPLTVKFIAESYVVSILITGSFKIAAISLLIIISIGIIGIARQFIILLYNVPVINKKLNNTISKRDRYIFIFISLLLISLNFICLFIN